MISAPGACSLSPHIVAREAGIALELVKVNLNTGQAEDGGDFRALNPKVYVPALALDDGQVLTEGPVILQYLADQKPSSRLAPPAGTMPRYRLQEWLTFLGTELHKSFTPLFNPQASEKIKRQAKQSIARRLTYLDQRLAEASYLMGDAFSVADAYAFTIVNWSHFVGIDLKPYLNLAAYPGRIALRPGVQEALKAEGLIQ